jgi:nitroreductase
MLKDLVFKNRSCRRFHQSEKVETKVLRELVDLARLTPSAKNLQPLKYILSNSREKNETIFRNLRWAGYLREGGIEIAEGERPAAYVIILNDRTLSPSPGCDHGIAAQTILLGAVEKGLAGCVIGSMNEKKIKEDLDITAQFDVLLAVAIGKPKEEVVIEEMRTTGDVRYWRDEKQVHHVPKRSLDDIIVSEE